MTFTSRLRYLTLLTAGAGLLGIACASAGDTATGPTQAPPVSSVSVTPGSQTILAGATSQFTATTKSAGGTVLTGRTVTWASSDVALATVSPTGLVTGVAPGGPVTITARSEGIDGTGSVTVLVSTVYDPVNDISWLADGNLPSSNRFGLPLCAGPGSGTCINASGSMRYDAAVAWVAAVNAANYLGHSTWQLPTSPVSDSGCGRRGPNGNAFGFGCVASALATLYNGLGLTAPASADPVTTGTVGPFRNIQPYLYWSDSLGTGASGMATFSFATGWQGANTLPNFLYAFPMIPGKLPGTPAATGTGLQVNPGGQTVYDPETNVTWLADANVAATNRFGLPVCTDPLTPALCVASDGAMTYASAQQLIANMNAAGYLGQSNWQLPPIDATCPGYGCGGIQNPLGNLFYTQLGFAAGGTVAEPDVVVGPFHDIQPYLYWSCSGATIHSACDAAGPSPNFEWSYSFGSGFEGTDLIQNTLFVTVYFVGRAN